MTGASFTYYPTHVATSHRKQVGYHFCVGSRAGGSNPRNTLSGSALLNKSEILPANQSAANLPSPGSGGWDLTIERTNSPVALVRSLFLPTRRDMWSGSLRFLGALVKALRSFSFRSLVQHPQKSGRSVFHRLVVPPVRLLSLLAAHESNVPEDLCHERQVTCKG